MGRSSKGKEGLIFIIYFAITIAGCGIDAFVEGHISKGFGAFVIFIWATLFVTALFERLDALLDYAEKIKEQNEEMKEQMDRLVETVDAIDGRVPRNTRSVLDEY